MRAALILVGILMTSVQFVAAQAVELPLLVEDTFEGDLSRWHTSDPKGEEPTWEVIVGDESGSDNRVLRSKGGSKYEPPHRSPWNIALLAEPVVSNLELMVRVQNTNYDAGDHRDLCIFWGYQDPAHFYYVHLGAKPDPHSCQIFIVNAADRKMITDKKSPGTQWDRGWHDVKVTRDTKSGDMKVYFDDMDEPVMTANDKTFSWGRVGVGTFDDNGNFDEFKLRGVEVKPIPAEAKLPGQK
jgi:hypothetical protein